MKEEMHKLWLQNDSLLYRLKDGANHDQIKVVQIDGSYATDETKWAALEIRRKLNLFDEVQQQNADLQEALKNSIWHLERLGMAADEPVLSKMKGLIK